MARGPKKHLKRINTPRSWLLSKMGGIYATRPSQGPHKLRECLPLAVILKYIFNHSGIVSDSLLLLAKPTSLSKTKKLESKSTIKSDVTSSSQWELWTYSPSPRPTRTTDFSMISRVVLPSTKSKTLKPNSNC